MNWHRFTLLLAFSGLAAAADQPSKEVEFRLTEGTWMSVDVSPDGKTLAFDLLGDIYSVPAAGGEATLVQGGPAMQRTPRFSPDGRRILFLSDASGVDNVWTCNTDGTDARQITHEERDLLMGPAWGPGGETVAAAKIYATFPAMHASEIRLFDLAGGSGRLLVETPANRRDVQEAVFSRDGRYLYYTERITNPHIYVDANHINFVIRRRDLQTGVTQEMAGGFGGAIAPQVSPDGKHLAFVRRVKSKTVLFDLDLGTGSQVPVYDELDRDIEADFVPHENYYPRFGWFPDSRHVAIWGKGRLFNIEMPTGTVREIPFQVTAHHRITVAPRFGHDLFPERFTVRAIRELAFAPDGKTLIFAALEHLWRQSSGKPSRLTGTQAFEFDPAYSFDGRRTAYVEWDDERGSALKLMSVAGGKSVTVATSRGVIRHPAFSRDGKALVFAIQDGDKSMGGFRAKAGIYRVPASGGEPRYLAPNGDAPMFSPDDSRIYYTVAERLESVDLDGHDVRVHAKARDMDTSELVLSPDLRWIAFKDRQQYYVMPYRESGSALTVSSTTDEVPVKRLTDAGGYALTWSPDSSTVHWALGPDLYQADVAGHFSAAAAHATVGLEVRSDAPHGTLAFTNGRIITMVGTQVIEHGTLIVTDNRITAVGPSDQIPVPKGAKAIDVSGKTLMPGLIDMHGHIDCCFGTGVAPQQQPARYAALAFGVTTNFDPYSSDLTSYESTETSLAGLTVSPRWIGSGAVVYGRAQKSDSYYTPIDSYEDAQRLMQHKQAVGGTFIKSYKQPSRRQRQQLIEAARAAGIMVDVEGEEHFYNNIDMIIDGHTNLEHSLPVANYYDDVIQLFAHSSTSNTPTLVVAFGELFGENYLYQTTRAWEDPKVKTYVQETVSDYSPLGPLESAPPYARGMTSIHVADELWDIGFRSVARSVKKLDEAGVLINVGSHGQLAGLAMHWEMWLMAQGGMSTQRILQAATLNGARGLMLDRQIGSLEAGKLADLIVLDRNPLDDIHNTNTVHYTMLNGRLYDSLSMNEIGNYDRPRRRFYWETTARHGSDWNESWAR